MMLVANIAFGLREAYKTFFFFRGINYLDLATERWWNKFCVSDLGVNGKPVTFAFNGSVGVSGKTRIVRE